MSPPAWFKAATVFKYGGFGVVIFIVLSGYCLAMPVAKQPRARLPKGPATFMARRARRIGPPYYAALGASLLLLVFAPGLTDPSGTQWDIALPGLAWEPILSHLALVHNVDSDWRWKINPPMWTVALEFQFYIVFALVLVPIWRHLGLRSLLASSIAVSVVGSIILGDGSGFWLLGLFAVGVAASSANFSARAVRHRGFGWLATALAVSSPAVVLAAFRALDGMAGTIVADYWIGVTTAVCLVALTQQLLEGRNGITLKVLSSMPAVWLGHRSYTIYLIHFPLIALLFVPVIRDFTTSSALSFGILVLLGAPCLLLATQLFHVAFERPFMVSQRQNQVGTGPAEAMGLVSVPIAKL